MATKDNVQFQLPMKTDDAQPPAKSDGAQPPAKSEDSQSLVKSYDPRPPVKSMALPESLDKLSCFGQPPLITGEDTKADNEFCAHISASLKPTDHLESIWAREAADTVYATELSRHATVVTTTI